MSTPAFLPHLVVVGNGMAAVRLLELLTSQPTRAFRISVFGAEPVAGYNRVHLSSLLAGDKSPEQIHTHPASWYAERGITLHQGDAVVHILPDHTDPDADHQGGSLRTASGHTDRWDRLVLATGADAIMPPLPGIGLGNVVSFRSLRDVEAMLAAAQQHRHAVVIGGGVLGLEAAWGLKQRGMDVTVVHMAATLMERLVDATAGTMIADHLDRHGIRCLTDTQASALHGNGRVQGVALTSGEMLPADLVVVAVGIRPHTALAADCGLNVGRGVLVDGHLRTSHPGIFALGECVEFDGQTFGLVRPLYDMATVLAEVLHDGTPAPFTVAPQSTVLKIPSLAVFCGGEAAPDEDHPERRPLIHHQPDDGIYKKVVLHAGRVLSAVLVGETGNSSQLSHWIASGSDVGHLCERSVLHGATEAASGEMIVCQCAALTRDSLQAAIRDQGLTTVPQLTTATRAGATCGQCVPQLARLLDETLERDSSAEIAALEQRTHAMRRGFTWWHRVHSTLMSLLLLTGLALHFPRSPFNLVGIEWSADLHEWSGLAVSVGFLVFIALTLIYQRRWSWSLDSVAMFAFVPLIVASGLVFWWPELIPHQFAAVRSTAWVALAHMAFAVLVTCYLLHHLSHAPFVWWKKRRALRPLSIRSGPEQKSFSPNSLTPAGRPAFRIRSAFFDRGCANEHH